MVTVAAWLFVVLVGCGLFMLFVGNPAIGWLDRRTSQITFAEARRRARLTMEGKWPPPPNAAPYWKPVIWTWVVIVAILAAWTVLRSWLQ